MPRMYTSDEMLVSDYLGTEITSKFIRKYFIIYLTMQLDLSV